jgi:hypothetical protein
MMKHPGFLVDSQSMRAVLNFPAEKRKEEILYLQAQVLYFSKQSVG